MFKILSTLNNLTESISFLAFEISEIRRLKESKLNCFKPQNKFATLKDLLEIERKIMSAISTFVDKQNKVNDRVDAAVVGLTADVKAQNDLIEKLQNSPGAITPEDQASLDALEARGDAIAAKLEALDAIVPPVAPAV